MAFYEEQFKEDSFNRGFSMLECIPAIITESQNEELIRMPEEEEIKNVVFLMNGDVQVVLMYSQVCFISNAGI